MSESNNSKQVAVGVFIAIGLAILVIGILTIGGQRKAFVPTFELRAVFDDVQGLQPGNNVWLSGMKVGTVRKVEFYGTAQVEVILNIDKKAQPHIRKDSRVKVSTDGLVGNKIVVIDAGTESSPAVANHDQLAAQPKMGADQIMATLQANNNNLLEITGNLKTISRKLSNGEGTIGALINDPAIGNSLKASIGNLQAASAGSQQIVANLRGFTADLRKPGGLANELATDTTVFQNLRGTMARFSQAAEAATQFAEKMRDAGDGVAAGLNNPDAPIGVLLHDEDAAADLQRTIRNLRVSSQELSDDLEAVQHHWLLRGFFKKRDKNK